jgi:aromatic-L-amino-acid decarboxylase
LVRNWSYGVKGLQEILRNHIKMACEAEKWIKESSDFELVAPRSLSLFNFRYCPAEITSQFEIDQLNERLLNQLNDTGEVYFTQNRVRGIYAIRWSIGQTNTLPIHIEKAWSTIQHVARGLI